MSDDRVLPEGMRQVALELLNYISLGQEEQFDEAAGQAVVDRILAVGDLREIVVATQIVVDSLVEIVVGNTEATREELVFDLREMITEL